MMKIYFIRHGESLSNQEKRFTGRFDSPLSELGREQAKVTFNFLKNTKFDITFSSPLNRAMETASIISPNTVIEKSEKLYELDGGVWNGDYYFNISKKYPDLILTYKNDLDNFKAINGESTKDVQKRIVDFVNELVELYEDKTICVITHAIVIRTLFAYYFNMKIKDLEFATNCSISVLEFDDKKLTQIKYSIDDFLEGKISNIKIS